MHLHIHPTGILTIAAIILASCTKTGAASANTEMSQDTATVEEAISAEEIKAEAINAEEIVSATENASDKDKPKTVSMAFVGDVMMGTNVPDNFITPDHGKSLFAHCDSIMRSADITIANLEGTCYNGTDGEPRKMTKDPKYYYIFRMPGDHAQWLVKAGVDAVNMANNHSFDFGLTGRMNTLHTMDSVGVKVVGIRDIAEGTVLVRDGVRYAYIGFAASCRDVLDMNNRFEVDAMIEKYRRLGDVLIVSFHGGAEGSDYTHVPKEMEIFLGEKRGNVYDFAHHCIDMGADIVIGHGPHVPRAMELYKNHLIAYSLGNFCTPYRVNLGGISGVSTLLTVNLDTSDGTFIDGKIHSFLQRRGAGPVKDASHTAAKTIRRLTNEDFPGTGIDIANNGRITKK